VTAARRILARAQFTGTMSSQSPPAAHLSKFAKVNNEHSVVMEQVVVLQDEVRRMSTAVQHLNDHELPKATNELSETIDTLSTYFRPEQDNISLIIKNADEQGEAMEAVAQALQNLAAQPNLTCYWPTSSRPECPVQALDALLWQWGQVKQCVAEYSRCVKLRIDNSV